MVSAQARGADVLPLKHDVIYDNRPLSVHVAHFNPQLYT